MGPNRGAQERERAAAGVKRAEAERKAAAEAQKIVASGTREAGGRALSFYPSVPDLGQRAELESKMSVSVANARVLTTGGGLLIVLSAIAVAQTPAPRSDTRSYEIGTLLEGEAYMIGKDMRQHRSNVR